MKKTTKGIQLTATMVVIMILWGALLMESVSIKIVKTAFELAIENDNASFYNEQLRKTDKMTEEYIEQQKIRNEKFYNSTDPLVNWYSNLHYVLKIGILIGAITIIIGVPVSVIRAIIFYLRYKNEFQKNQRKIARLQRMLEDN